MTDTLTAPAQPHTCSACQHTALIAAVSAEPDPDRLADRVRAELTRYAPDQDDADVLLFADGMLLVDTAEGEVWEGQYTRTADQQLRLALVHLAAALAAGARI
ncbi:Uncharacterised protein [Mycobacteroides abscessus subsp. abscessus]|uniref:hypothetical protein n=1 Tax=Mycobacteriaceae TaxID=1762 RepID=UPI0005E46056|nr:MULTISPECIES: hypothetical protein [Mycobacteriaceae]ANO17372.1 hypothetical protein BAB78_01205 [Mycobacteroides abscessus]MCW1823161.1 hypothetical protein [Mycolicibacterium senegalense]MDB2220988.1 hypothetical protein [Mycobacteroides abscessus subsp. abscessus]OTR08820.1 hypothetical protein B9M85_01145 [Mycobacteroides abscessus]CPR89853.1 Uncharacterised protein [Mycobacteroides abscessus]